MKCGQEVLEILAVMIFDETVMIFDEIVMIFDEILEYMVGNHTGTEGIGKGAMNVIEIHTMIGIVIDPGTMIEK
jgi:uncharacterized membrane protein